MSTETKNKKIVILYSGGIDSVAMYELAKIQGYEKVKCVYIDYGSPVCKSEIKHLPDFVEVKRIDWFNDSYDKLLTKKGEENKGAIYIAGRNLMFTTYIACTELPNEIWLGSLIEECHDDATDKNFKFQELANKTIQYTLSPFQTDIQLVYPLVQKKWNKQDVINFLIDVAPTKLQNSISCYHPIDGISCGTCHQCFRTRLYTIDTGINIQFKQDPIASEFGYNYLLDTINTIKLKKYDTALIYDLDYKSLLEFIKKDSFYKSTPKRDYILKEIKTILKYQENR